MTENPKTLQPRVSTIYLQWFSDASAYNRTLGHSQTSKFCVSRHLDAKGLYNSYHDPVNRFTVSRILGFTLSQKTEMILLDSLREEVSQEQTLKP